MRKAKFLVLLFISVCVNSNAQNDGKELLKDLITELFPIQSDTIKLSKYLIDCQNHIIDSNAYIRKAQPNRQKVANILERIMYSSDTVFLPELKSIYSKQLDCYLKEWDKVDRDNRYSCSIARDQTRILKGFEVVLTSLYMSQLSNQQKFEYYFEEIKRNLRLIKFPSKRAHTLQQYKVFDERYRTVFSRGWLQEGCNFNYIDPYIEELAPYFIQKINEVNSNSEQSLDLVLILSNCSMADIKSEAFIDALSNKSDDLFHYSYGAVIFKDYLTNNYNEELLRKYVQNALQKSNEMIDRLERGMYLWGSFSILSRNNKNLEFILNELEIYSKNTNNLSIVTEALESIGVHVVINFFDSLPKDRQKGYKIISEINQNFRNNKAKTK